MDGRPRTLDLLDEDDVEPEAPEPLHPAHADPRLAAVVRLPGQRPRDRDERHRSLHRFDEEALRLAVVELGDLAVLRGGLPEGDVAHLAKAGLERELLDELR